MFTIGLATFQSVITLLGGRWAFLFRTSTHTNCKGYATSNHLQHPQWQIRQRSSVWTAYTIDIKNNEPLTNVQNQAFFSSWQVGKMLILELQSGSRMPVLTIHRICFYLSVSTIPLVYSLKSKVYGVHDRHQIISMRRSHMQERPYS